MKDETLKESELRSLSPLVLAFMGDAVYEALMREKLIIKNQNLQISRLHQLDVSKVKASAQARAYDYILPKLSMTELEIIKRGRNAHSGHCPKSSNPIEYHKSTGLETLFGYLFFSSQQERLKAIFDEIYNFLDQD